MSASTSTSTSALPTLRQALCQLSAPSSLPTSQFGVRCWTSTCELPSGVCTAGPQPGSCPAQCAPPAGSQPGSCPAQCAPLDLNRGPAQLSVHRWTSTARRPDRMPEDLPNNMTEDMPDRMPEDMPDRMVENMSDRMPEDIQIKCYEICQIECQKICQIEW